MGTKSTNIHETLSNHKGLIADIDQFVVYRGEIYGIKDLLQEKFMYREIMADLEGEQTKIKDQLSILHKENKGLSDQVITLTATADRLTDTFNLVAHELETGNANIKTIKAFIDNGKRGLDALFDIKDHDTVKPAPAIDPDLLEPALSDIEPADPAPEIEPAPAPAPEKCRCPHCKSDKIGKWGFKYKSKDGVKLQQCRCKNCGKVFTPGYKQPRQFNGKKGNGKRLSKKARMNGIGQM